MLHPDQTYAATWRRFTRLSHTQDSLALERRGLRRWLLLPYVAFVIPIDDPAVIAQLTAWQAALRPWLGYDPQPAARLHITLHHVGGLRRTTRFWLPHAWRRVALEQLVDRVRPTLEASRQFDVRIGPLNAFPAVLFAEVQEAEPCLRLLRARLRRALPLRARPPLPWSFVPHVTLGYWGRQAVAPLVRALEPYRAVEPVPLHIQRVQLTIYTTDLAPLGRDVLNAAGEEILAEYRLAG